MISYRKASTKATPDSLKFCDLLTSLNLKQHVRESTHEKGHTLDLVITRANEDLISSISTNQLLPSDHAEIIMELCVNKPSNLKSTVRKRPISSIDIDEFRTKLEPLRNVDEFDDVNELLNLYESVVTNALDKLAPVQSKLVIDRPRAPWYSEELSETRKQLRAAERKWQSSKLEIDRQIFRSARQEYTTLVDSARRLYHQNRIDTADSGQLFRIVDELVGQSKITKSKLPTNIPSDELPDKFCTFFKEKIDKLRSKITPELLPEEQSFENKLCKFEPISLEEIKKTVLDCTKKSCTLDTLPVGLIRSCLDDIAPFLLKLFNVSFETGTVPDGFKHATVRPLIKKPNADPDILNNYRPVSNVPCLFKSIEKLAASRLHDHLSSFSLYAKCQSAYRKHHSVETALLKVHTDIVTAIDQKKHVILVLLDLSAAFDTLDHKILIERLESRFGVSGIMLNWFRSYLENRTQSVSINGFNSEKSELECGVPQGTVLGPTLFTLYTAPLEDILVKHGCDFMLFADDTQLYITCKNPSTVKDAIELCIDDIRKWMRDNLLMLNDSKTEVIYFSSRYCNSKCSPSLESLRIGDSTIETSHTVRNLGVMFDENLTLSSHIKSICKSASFALYKIGKIRRMLDQNTTEKLVHAFVTSRLDSCNSLLLGVSDSEIEKLQLLQNSAARMITGAKKFDHITPVLYSLHWLPIPKRIEFKVLLTVFKIIHGLAPSYLTDLIQPFTSRRALRSSHELFKLDEARGRKPSEGTVYYSNRNFKYAAPKLWNLLPDSVKCAPNVEIFKRRLKTHLFTVYYTARS